MAENFGKSSEVPNLKIFQKFFKSEKMRKIPKIGPKSGILGSEPPGLHAEISPKLKN